MTVQYNFKRERLYVRLDWRIHGHQQTVVSMKDAVLDDRIVYWIDYLAQWKHSQFDKMVELLTERHLVSYVPCFHCAIPWRPLL